MALQGRWPSTTVGIMTCSIPHQKLFRQSAKISSFDFSEVRTCSSCLPEVPRKTEWSFLLCSVYVLRQPSGASVCSWWLHTDGQPRESAAWFWRWLEEAANDFCFGKTYLKGLRYAVFGLGKLCVCCSLQHSEYLLCSFLCFLLLWKAELS